MHVVPLIEQKRNGEALAPDDWSSLVRAYTAGHIPDYQMAALLMAVYLNGMAPGELAALTDAMLRSGASLHAGDGRPPRVDKHSTGGVGDKVSIVLAPMVAACGVTVPMMSGRGLGHTGGTLDKLESIPGFRTDLTLAAARRQLDRIGCALIGQTAEIAPADQKLYALRDATATVESTPLIAASIMSKKLAEGLTGLVLDIKRGSGAFLPDLEDELELARTMINLGEERGCPTVALVTAMDRPLGYACGNALETAEAVRVLQGTGPPDVLEVALRLGVEMLLLAGVEQEASRARATLEHAISSGSAIAKFADIVEAQGGNPALAEDPGLLPQAPLVETYEASSDGYVTEVAPRVIGKAVVALGGGRHRKEDDIDAAVGFVIETKPGDRVHRGQPLASMFVREASQTATARAALNTAIHLASDPTVEPLPLISHRVTKQGVESLD